MKNKNAFMILSLFMTMITSNSVLAQRAEDLGGPITVGGAVNLDYNTNGTFGTESYVTVSAKLSKNIKAVLKLELDRYFYNKGVEVEDDFDIESFIEEAYISFKDVGGKLSAVIVGKQPIQLGTHASSMPNEHNSPTHEAIEIEQVFGVTVVFENVGFLDLVKASVYESESDDLSIGEVNGVAISLEKNITNSLKLALSAAQVEREDQERIVTVGFINKVGKWKTYGEVIYREGHEMDHDGDHDDLDDHDDDGHLGHFGHHDVAWEGNWAAMLGAAKKMGPGVVAVEVYVIQDTLTQVGLGYIFQITDTVSVGPEYRYTRKEDGDTDNSIAVRVSVKFGKKGSEGHGHDHDGDHSDDASGEYDEDHDGHYHH